MDQNYHPVPPATVARVFREVAFRHDSRISASTVALSTEYLRLFVHEAIARANAQRLADLTTVDGIDNVPALEPELAEQLQESMETEDIPTQMPEQGNDTLDTRHLAAVAGLLVLDF